MVQPSPFGPSGNRGIGQWWGSPGGRLFLWVSGIGPALVFLAIIWAATSWLMAVAAAAMLLALVALVIWRRSVGP